MDHKRQPATIPTHTRRRTLRRLGWTFGFSVVRGIGYATGTALVTVLIWWLSSR
jgi:hypothetical protein